MKVSRFFRNPNSKIISNVCTTLVVAQLTAIFGSWVWSAAMPESNLRSLLSDAGVRWFFGTFVANLANPLLVWLILLDSAIGMLDSSGLLKAMYSFFDLKIHKTKNSSIGSQQSSGIKAAMVVLMIEIAIIMFLTLPPHAILLSVTGELFPSSFSVSIIPIIAVIGISTSIVYGLLSGTFHNYSDVVQSACFGGKWLKTILLVYVLAVELYYSIVYILG